jgi:hypothetical protein
MAVAGATIVSGLPMLFLAHITYKPFNAKQRHCGCSKKMSIYSKLCAETMHDPLASALGRQLCLLIEVKQFHG